jgi:sugar/nucleoside kinase (ribokinase family)
MDLVTFSLIIDDIVFPDGHTAMTTLGGGGPQTAFGMRLWSNSVGLSAGIGADLPDPPLHWLQSTGIDTAGLRLSSEWPTPRAWQVLESDGRRTQVWRTPMPAIAAQLGRNWNLLPEPYRQAKGYHLGVHPEEPDLEFIDSLRNAGAVVSVEPFRAAQTRLTDVQLRALVSAGQIFSPNEREAESLVGKATPAELIQRLEDAGAQIVALRRGAGGALVHQTGGGSVQMIPPFQTKVIDPTGAGNAFCGGLLAGWVQTENLTLAGLYGVVAASFMVEQIGLPESRPNWSELARSRLNMLRHQMSLSS